MLDLEGKAGQYIELAIGTAAIIIVGLIIIKLALKITRKALVKTTLDGAMYKFVLNVIKAVLGVVLIVVSLGYLKVPTAPLVTVLGAGGAAIALALKDSLGNIAGGIIILANKPFKKGDVIDVAGTSGIVESIDLFVTTLKTYDNKVIAVPNGSVTTSVIVNYSSELEKSGLHFESAMTRTSPRQKTSCLPWQTHVPIS
ncbi:MAG: mechanosensitive ion channel family protein [Anaerovoracaceae bacterium]